MGSVWWMKLVFEPDRVFRTKPGDEIERELETEHRHRGWPAYDLLVGP